MIRPLYISVPRKKLEPYAAMAKSRSQSIKANTPPLVLGSRHLVFKVPLVTTNQLQSLHLQPMSHETMPDFAPVALANAVVNAEGDYLPPPPPQWLTLPTQHPSVMVEMSSDNDWPLPPVSIPMTSGIHTSLDTGLDSNGDEQSPSYVDTAPSSNMSVPISQGVINSRDALLDAIRQRPSLRPVAQQVPVQQLQPTSQSDLQSVMERELARRRGALKNDESDLENDTGDEDWGFGSGYKRKRKASKRNLHTKNLSKRKVRFQSSPRKRKRSSTINETLTERRSLRKKMKTTM